MDTLIIISVIALIVSILILFFGFRQYVHQHKSIEYRVLYDLMSTIRTDLEMNEALYKIEYDKHWYNDDFHNSNLEKKVDKMLSFLDFSCYLFKEGTLDENKFYFFKYQIESILVKKPMQDYIHNLILWSY